MQHKHNVVLYGYAAYLYFTYLPAVMRMYIYTSLYIYITIYIYIYFNASKFIIFVCVAVCLLACFLVCCFCCLFCFGKQANKTNKQAHKQANRQTSRQPTKQRFYSIAVIAVFALCSCFMCPVLLCWFTRFVFCLLCVYVYSALFCVCVFVCLLLL